MSDTAKETSKAIEAKLSRGDWGKMSLGLGGAVAAAIGWAVSLNGNVSAVSAKLDMIQPTLQRVEARMDKIEDRLLDVERPRARKPKAEAE